jgi:hypothetical protein
MTTPNLPGDGHQPDDGAEVVSLDAARANRPAPAPEPDTTPDTESVRVDQPGGHRGDWRAELAAKARHRRPVIPGWLRSRREATATGKWLATHCGQVSAYHTVRAPAYGAKLAARSPRGLAKVVSGLVRWTFELEGHPVRMATVTKADPEAYLKLSRQRDSRVRLRVAVTLAALVVAGYLAAVTATAPPPLRLAALALVLAVLGIIGAPVDRPLIDRAVVASRVEKLTSDIVIRALGSLGIARDQPGDRQEPARRDRVQSPDHPRRSRLARRPGPALRRHGRRNHGPPRQARLRAAAPARLRVARSRPRPAHRPPHLVGGGPGHEQSPPAIVAAGQARGERTCSRACRSAPTSAAASSRSPSCSCRW